MPPVAVVAWIYVLGRRERRDPPEDELHADDGRDGDDARAAPAAGRDRSG